MAAARQRANAAIREHVPGGNNIIELLTFVSSVRNRGCAPNEKLEAMDRLIRLNKELIRDGKGHQARIITEALDEVLTHIEDELHNIRDIQYDSIKDRIERPHSRKNIYVDDPTEKDS